MREYICWLWDDTLHEYAEIVTAETARQAAKEFAEKLFRSEGDEEYTIHVRRPDGKVYEFTVECEVTVEIYATRGKLVTKEEAQA